MNEQQIAKANENSFKIVLIGAKNVGKSAIVLKYVNQSYNDTYIETLGIDFRLKTLELELDGKFTVKLMIWEIAGTEIVNFQQMRNNCLKCAHGIFYVYDTTNKESFEYIKLKIQENEKISDAETIKYLIGSKCDLTSQRAVKAETALKFAKEKQFRFYEVSSKQSFNVEDIFVTITSDIKKRIDKYYCKRK